MSKDEIIAGLKFTVGMFLFDADTGENLTEPRNDLDKTTVDACRGAIELLEKYSKDLKIISEALVEITEWECCSYGHTEACNIADKYTEKEDADV